MTLGGIRNNLVILVIGLYLVLNSGFMLVRIPPGAGVSGVPVGEILLVLFFLSVNDVKWLPRFSHSIFLLPFLLWWVMGIGRALTAVPEHGMWALRDATHVVESLFLWVGFVFAASPKAVDSFFIWLHRVLAIGCVYAFSFPFRETLKDFSPTIEAAAGYTTTLLFQYVNTALLMLMEASRRFIERGRGSGLGSLLIAGILIAFAVAFFQARTVYLQVIALLILFVWLRRKSFGKIGLALTVGGLAFLFVASSGIEITGRQGQAVSLDFLGNHFLAIFGVESEGVVGAARGVGQRLDWWAIIWRQLTEDVGSFFFGLGYGVPLIDFLGNESTIVREPHNSYMSILGRMGLTGVIVFTSGHVLLLRVWIKAYRLCRRAEYRIGQDRLLLLMVYFVLVWVFSLGEDAFEKPFITIPYYFFWGIVLHYYQHLKRELAETADGVNSAPGNSYGPIRAHPSRP